MFTMFWPWAYHLLQMFVEMIIKDMIKGLPGVINIADDLLIFGSTIEEHDKNLNSSFGQMKRNWTYPKP